MGVTIGPADWWARSAEAIRPLAIACPVATTLPDGSRIICKAGGTAWIIAPSTTQVSTTWNGTTTTQVGDKCCICDWPTLNTQLINCGFNPSDWFVPSLSQLTNPGISCISQWDTCTITCIYWSSTEATATTASGRGTDATNRTCSKSTSCWVRAMRCVTY